MDKIKNFFKKVGEKIKKAGQWIVDHAREVLKMIAGAGVSALVVGVYTTVGNKNHPVIYVLEYVGALALAMVLTHATEHYIDEGMDDILESVQQVKDAVQMAAAQAAVEVED